MKRLLQSSEWVNGPRPHDAVHDDEIASFGIFFGCVRKDSHNDLVLLTRFREIGWNLSLLNEVPEIIRMQMHCWRDRCRNKASCCGAFHLSLTMCLLGQPFYSVWKVCNNICNCWRRSSSSLVISDHVGSGMCGRSNATYSSSKSANAHLRAENTLHAVSLFQR